MKTLRFIERWLHYRIMKSGISQDGIFAPILITSDGIIIDGHHRVRIAKELGIKVPAIVITEKVINVDPNKLSSL